MTAARRVAAILALDVVRDLRLMGGDEAMAYGDEAAASLGSRSVTP
jgi:hypothetical protein